MMKKIGIDLGTSNSLVSFWNGEQSELIPNQFGEYLTPSAVGINEKKEIVVGSIAKERQFTHPHKTATTFKRFIGTEKKYTLGDKEFSSTELSALILKSLKQDAENFFGEPCSEAIISVPAYFNNIQREATKQAAQLAGLNVQQLVSEPTAAAVAYGLHREDDQTIIVIDLGGGTFDVSLLELFEGILQVEAIAGDNQLGGEDFTRILMLDFLQQNSLEKLVLTTQEQALLYSKMEHVKLALSIHEAVKIEITLKDTIYRYSTDIKKYEQLCEKLLGRIRRPIIRAIHDANKTLTEIDRVVLVGGATKSPMIRNFIGKLLKIFPYTKLAPDETVAYGVGIQASMKSDLMLKDEMILTDVCAHTLGVDSMSKNIHGEWIDGIFSPIIERNTSIPVSKQRTYYTVIDNQKEIVFPIYQGENPRSSDNLKIGEISMKLPQKSAGYPIDIRFTYDQNGLLEVIVKDAAANSEKRLVIEENPGSLTSEEIDSALEKLAGLKIHPKNRSENQLIIARLERLYMEFIGERRNYIQHLLIQFKALLDEQDEKLLEEQLVEYNQIIMTLEQELLL
ncbi:Hsp70 family protein [Vagococcus entomophilus]